MNSPTKPEETLDTGLTNAHLAAKIARLIEERGWNQEDFARITGLNRQTVHQILNRNGDRRLRNATVGACAQALELSVNDLRELPLDRLLSRINSMPRPALRTPAPSVTHRDNEGPSPLAQHFYEQAMQPELRAWIERNPDRAAQLNPGELDELLSLQGTDGPLTAFGVEHFVELIERKRKLIDRVHTIAGTEYLELLEKFVELLHEKVQPYRERT